MGAQWTIQTAIQSTYKVWISEDTKSNSLKTIFILKTQITNSAIIPRQAKSKSSVLQAENVQQPFEEHSSLFFLFFCHRFTFTSLCTSWSNSRFALNRWLKQEDTETHKERREICADCGWPPPSDHAVPKRAHVWFLLDVNPANLTVFIICFFKYASIRRGNTFESNTVSF